jgi:branched-chain amino acid transport system ATP-binding protein
MNQTAEPARTVLSVEGVSVQFGGLVALSDLNLYVREGEIASLIGPNGAGKTTAFNVITGFLKPTNGSVHYNGVPLNSLRPNQIAGLGVIRTFQKTSVFGGIPVFENILIGLHRRAQAGLWEILLARSKMRAEERRLRKLAMEILNFVGLTRRRDELGSALPYGDQRLLEVAVAMAANPSLLLLDEPVSGMNPSETANFMEMVGKIRQRGITILLVEHDMRMVMGVSDRVVVLNQGKIIAEGAPDEIQRNPEVIRAYLGHGVESA